VEEWVSVEAKVVPSGEGPVEVEGLAAGLEEVPEAASAVVAVAVQPAAGVAIAPK